MENHQVPPKYLENSEKKRWKALDRASNELRLLLRAALARDPSLGDFWKTWRLGKMSDLKEHDLVAFLPPTNCKIVSQVEWFGSKVVENCLGTVDQLGLNLLEGGVSFKFADLRSNRPTAKAAFVAAWHLATPEQRAMSMQSPGLEFGRQTGLLTYCPRKCGSTVQRVRCSILCCIKWGYGAEWLYRCLNF